MVRALERREQFTDGRDLKVWLMAVLHNHFIDQTRSHRAARASGSAWVALNAAYAVPDGEDALRPHNLRHQWAAIDPRPVELLHPPPHP